MAYNYTFPLIITAPPYNWSEINSGLIAVAGAIGVLLAWPFLPLSDRVAAYFTRKNNGIREAEMRLVTLFPGMIISPAGLILYGLAAQYQLNWFAYMAGVCMSNFGSLFYFTNTLVISSHLTLM